MRMRTVLVVVGLVAFAGGPANAGAKTRIDSFPGCAACFVKPGTHYQMHGTVKPPRPGTIVLQRRSSGAWRTVGRDALDDVGRYIVRSKRKSPLGKNDYRACLSRVCTKVDHPYVGRLRKLSSLTPAAASADFSVGPMSVDIAKLPAALRFHANDTGAVSFVEYALPGPCTSVSGRIAIDNSAQDLTVASISLTADGREVGTLTVNSGTFTDVPEIDIDGARRLRIAGSAEGDPGRSGIFGVTNATALCAW